MPTCPFIHRASLLAALVLVLSLTFNPFACAQADDEKQWHQPTLLPDRIMLGFTADPTTSVSVNWRTAVDVTKPVAEIAEAGDGPDFAKDTLEQEASSQILNTDINEAAYHTVTFSGLRPD